MALGSIWAGPLERYMNRAHAAARPCMGGPQTRSYGFCRGTIAARKGGEGVKAIADCERSGQKYRVRLVQVELIGRSKGVAWMDAYRQSRRG